MASFQWSLRDAQSDSTLQPSATCSHQSDGSAQETLSTDLEASELTFIQRYILAGLHGIIL